jgi:hypothetical protein
MELSIKVTLKMELGMDLAFKFGLTVQNMKVSGDITKRTVKVNSGMRTVIYTKACGKTIKQTDTVSTFMSMEPNMKDIGGMIFRTVKVLNHGVTVANMKVDTKKE